MSAFKEYIAFEYKGKFISIKPIYEQKSLEIHLPGVSKHIIDASQKQRLQITPEGQDFLIAKIDFLHAIQRQVSMVREKYKEIFLEPIWKDISAGAKNPKATSEFLKNEESFLMKKIELFFENLNAEVAHLGSLDELLKYRRKISSNYALGGLSNLMQGTTDDL